MTLAWILLLALALDTALGDPRWLPHPVRGMGLLAERGEKLSRAWIADERCAGIVCTAAVTGLGAGLAGLTVHAAGTWHPAAEVVLAGVWLYTAVALRDLLAHAGRVAAALERGDLAESRARVGMMVGRDTAILDEEGVARACLESLGENLVDGVTSAFFFACIGGLLGGPVGAAAAAAGFRAANTLDAMHGHLDEHFRAFGWAAAKLDDLLNWVPTRLTVPAAVLGAWLLHENARGCWAVYRRDGLNHASPNSAVPEACLAGALNVRLGGPTRYRGAWMPYPAIGAAGQPAGAETIRRGAKLVAVTAVVFALALIVIALGLGEEGGP